jgi:penicillin-binding protein-related factor A (putative recombinase)
MVRTNYGKKFEDVIREAFEKVPGVSIDRLHDQTTKFKGTSANICDFIVYREPYEYYFECKSVHGNLFPFRNITETQLNGLLEKSKIEGVFAGIICWWVDKDFTAFIPIQNIERAMEADWKSFRYDLEGHFIEIRGKKKRVFFEYDMESFLDELSNM